MKETNNTYIHFLINAAGYLIAIIGLAILIALLILITKLAPYPLIFWPVLSIYGIGLVLLIKWIFSEDPDFGKDEKQR